MSHASFNASLRSAQLAYDNLVPPSYFTDEADEDRCEEIREAIKADLRFIDEAIGDGSRSIAAAFRLGFDPNDPRVLSDAIFDAIDAYWDGLIGSDDNLERHEELAKAYGVAA